MPVTIARFGTHPLMSDATVFNGVAYLSGQVALDRPNATFKEQALAVFSRIDDLLAQVGSDRSRLLSASVWLADLSDFSEFNTLWQDWLSGLRPPARATVGAPLALPGLKVEVQVTAAA